MGFQDKRNPGLLISLMLFFIAIMIPVFGCGQEKAAGPPPPQVRAIEVKSQRVPIILEFVGQVESAQEVQIRARVSGLVMQKYVPGGQDVKQGQVLFQIDPDAYEMNVLDAQGQLADAQAALRQQQQNLARMTRLVAAGAAPRQEYDNAVEQEKQLAARVNSVQAKLNKTKIDLDNTKIVAPISGRMDTNNLAVGNYVQQGTTVLATVSSIDPILVRFSLSESEYLYHVKHAVDTQNTGEDTDDLDLVLEDGSVYAHRGRITQADRGLSAGTGTLTLKAQFPNITGLLRAGMFARVRATIEMRDHAILVPQRAVQDLMGKSMLTIAGEGDKAEVRAVRTGVRMGHLWLIEDGLKPGERVVVDGIQKVRPGQLMKVEVVSIDEYTPKKDK